MTHRPATIDEVRSLARQMANHPADAVALASQLQRAIRELPPDRAELESRPLFERSSLWTLAASFQDLELTDDTTIGPEIIRVPEDCWVRGVSAQLIVNYAEQGGFDTLGFLKYAQFQNNRQLFELNYRIDGKQGFVGDGTSEILASAQEITGDGQPMRPLDWELEKNQTIEVRIRSLLRDIFPSPETPPIPVPWVVVAFWAESS